jgi:hypothetical protein
MGAPTSTILVETFIQHMEHEHIYPLLKTHEIIAYYRYVDDMFIIYDQNKANMEQTLNEFINIQLSINHWERTIQENQLFRHYNTPEGQKIRIFSIQKTVTDWYNT